MFFDPQGFDFVPELVSRWRLIRQEAQELEAAVLDRPDSVSPHHLAETAMQSQGWSRMHHIEAARSGGAALIYLLSYRGMLADRRGQTMPTTARLLSRLRGARMCALSLMPPGSYVAPHNRADLGGRFLMLHLGLTMQARRSYLTVAGDAREEAPGRALAFNPGREHHAINMGTTGQIVLQVEFDPRDARFEG